MTEAQKYQGHLYRGEKKKGNGPQQKQDRTQAMVPHQATVEDEFAAGTVAVVDVPPKAPSPPPTSNALPPGVNVFDFLVKDHPAKSTAHPDADSASYIEKGYTYGSGPIPGDVMKTPAPKRPAEEKKSEKKRKRDGQYTIHESREQEMSDAPSLHTGLTGGMNKMLSGTDFNGSDEATPLNPDKKRSKKDRSDRHEEKRKTSGSTTKSKEDRSRDKKLKAIDYRPTAEKTSSSGGMVTYRSPADLFLSFVNKGPDSDRGLSINKALKRYHREQEIRGDKEDDKDLWKRLRVRKNERGEVVLFT